MTLPNETITVEELMDSLVIVIKRVMEVHDALSMMEKSTVITLPPGYEKLRNGGVERKNC